MPAGWAAAIAGIATVAGAAMSSDAAKDAAETQADATRAGIDANQAQADRTREDFRPQREAGYRAIGMLEREMGAPVTAADAMSDPGYQFGLQQGQQALDRKAAAGGGRVSGAALKAASEYATNYAATGYNAAYGRRQDRLNRLSALAGIGQSATQVGAALGGQSAAQNAGLLSAQGNAAAAGQLAQGNIWGNAGNQLGAIGQRWANQPRQIDGFNGDQYRGYTNQYPADVGPAYTPNEAGGYQ